MTLLLSPGSLTMKTIEIRIQKKWRCSPKKRGQHLHYCGNCVTRGPIYCRARVTFHNFAETNALEFLLTGQALKSGRMIGLAMLVD